MNRWESEDLQSWPKVLGHFRKNTAKSPIPSSTPYSVDLKGPSHPESLQALSTLLGGGWGRAVTKTVCYKQSNRLTQGIFHKCPILRMFLPGVPRTFGQDYWNLALFLK